MTFATQSTAFTLLACRWPGAHRPLWPAVARAAPSCANNAAVAEPVGAQPASTPGTRGRQHRWQCSESLTVKAAGAVTAVPMPRRCGLLQGSHHVLITLSDAWALLAGHRPAWKWLAVRTVLWWSLGSSDSHASRACTHVQVLHLGWCQRACTHAVEATATRLIVRAVSRSRGLRLNQAWQGRLGRCMAARMDKCDGTDEASHRSRARKEVVLRSCQPQRVTAASDAASSERASNR